MRKQVVVSVIALLALGASVAATRSCERKPPDPQAAPTASVGVTMTLRQIEVGVSAKDAVLEAQIRNGSGERLALDPQLLSPSLGLVLRDRTGRRVPGLPPPTPRTPTAEDVLVLAPGESWTGRIEIGRATVDPLVDGPYSAVFRYGRPGSGVGEVVELTRVDLSSNQLELAVR